MQCNRASTLGEEREERERRKKEEERRGKSSVIWPYTLHRVYAHTQQALHTDGTTELLQLALEGAYHSRLRRLYPYSKISTTTKKPRNFTRSQAQSVRAFVYAREPGLNKGCVIVYVNRVNALRVRLFLY